MTGRLWPWLAALFALFLLSSGQAAAHAIDVASAHVAVHGAKAEVVVIFDGANAPGLDANGDGQVGQDEIDAGVEGLSSGLRAAVLLRGPQPPSELILTRYEVVGSDSHAIRLTLDARFAGPVRKLTVTSRMSALLGQPTPLLVTVSGAGPTGRVLMREDGETASFAAARPWTQVFASFVRLGVEHIFTGYDHLAFLMCLLLGAANRRSLIWTVTAFTLAHSVTLSAATLNIVHLPGPLVETAIAATIIYVAVENLTGSRLVQRPWITGAFGLIHGFGFAGALQEIGLPQGQTALSLLAFNLGVEIGQLVFVGVAWLILGAWVTSPRLRTAVSAGAVCIAVFWFVQRVALVA